MARPLIGITTDYNDRLTQYALPYTYAASVERAGGLPLMLPYRVDLSLIPEVVDALDGVLFTGGNDLDPKAYGEEWHPMAVPVDPARETFERALITEVEKRRMPAMGICLGSQLMNLHRGGAMHQFIPDAFKTEIEHRNLDREWRGRHEVALDDAAIITKAIGKKSVVVNTSHKQSIKTPGRGLRVIATAPDGVIEGIEDPTFPLFVGVQWHPERMVDEADHLSLFKLLVAKAAERS